MITLEQVKLLEQKIEAAVGKIAALRTENASLKGMCDDYDAECTRLQSEADSLKRNADRFPEELSRLQGENTTLQNERSALSSELALLKANAEKFQSEQIQIEEAVLHVIDRLEAVETTILETVVTQAEGGSSGASLAPSSAVPPPVSEGTSFAAEALPPESEAAPPGAPAPNFSEGVEIASFDADDEDNGGPMEADSAEAMDLF